MRSIKNLVLSVSKLYHWRGLWKAIYTYKYPLREILNYSLKGRSSNLEIELTNGLKLKLREPGDLITVHEIFCRNDYPVTGTEKFILDLGANIGVSALFFASNCPRGTIVSYEPDPRNFSLFELNTELFSARIKLIKSAVVPTATNQVEFTQLSSSRLGGVGLNGGNKITVAAKNINDIIRDAISEFGKIDILKIDIESLEDKVVSGIERKYLVDIDRIYVELPYGSFIELVGFSNVIQGQVHKFKNSSNVVDSQT